MSVEFVSVKYFSKLENLLVITFNYEHFCKISTRKKLTYVFYRFLLYFPNFYEDIL